MTRPKPNRSSDDPRQPSDGGNDPFDLGSNVQPEVEDRSGDTLILDVQAGITDAWSHGKWTLHVHARVHPLGEAVADQLCWTFRRNRAGVRHSDFKGRDHRIPTHEIGESPGVGEGEPRQKGVVFVDVRQAVQDREWVRDRGRMLPATVGLRLLDDCPCVPVYRYPIQGAAILASLWQHLNLGDELGPVFVDGKGVARAWPLSFS